MKEPVVLVIYTESGIRLDDGACVNLEWGYSIEFGAVLENTAARSGDQEETYVRDGYGNRNAIHHSHIDRFQTVFNIKVQEWTNATAHGEHTGSTSRDGYAVTSVVDAALESQASGRIGINVKVIDKPEFCA